jgi:hypothetical protein
MSTYRGSTEPAGSVLLDYEETLAALLSIVGREVLVLFSGVGESPFVAGVVSGRLDRGELDGRLQDVLLRSDVSPVETLFFHVGSRQTGFVIRPDEFVQALRWDPTQLTIRLGSCAVTVLTRGELGEAIRRG